MPTNFIRTYQNPVHPTAAQIADIDYACNQWSALLINNNLDINVQIWAVDMSHTNLNAMCIPGIFQGGGRTRTRPQAKLNGDIPHNDPAIDLVVVMDINTAWVLRPALPNPLQYNLATTIMHELCHGLGFLGLCNVNAGAHTGTYTDAATLIPTVNHILGLMIPNVVLPAHFFPAVPLSGIAVITPFADLFTYANHLVKGIAADDYTAFITPADITLVSPHIPVALEVLTDNPFSPFTTCDHITGAPYLMNETTAGQNYNQPDNASKEVLRAIGWDVL